MDNLLSLIFYLSSFFVSALFVYIGDKHKSSIYTFIGLLIPALISGLRFNVGTDYFTYSALYNNMSGLSFDSYVNTYGLIDPEPTVYFVMNLSSLLTNGPIVFFAIYSSITILFFYLGLKRLKTRYAYLVFLLYLLTIFPLTFNMVRQGAAISICFYASTFILDRNFKKYLIWIIVAGMFHFSALMMLPVYFINRLVKNDNTNHTRNLIKIVAIAIVIALSIPIVLQVIAYIPILEKYARYTDMGIGGEVKNYSFYLKLAFAVIVACFYKRLATKDNSTVYLFAFIIIEITLLTIGFSADFMRRSAVYFSLFSLVLLPNISDAFSDKFGKRTVSYVLILYGLVYFVIAYFIFGNSDIFPYNSIWTTTP